MKTNPINRSTIVASDRPITRMLCAAMTAGLALATLAPTRAEAREWADVGPWMIVETDEVCIMTTAFEGPGSSRLTFGTDGIGRNVLTDTNDQWSIVVGQTYEDITFRLGEAVYKGPVKGIELIGSKGFSMSLQDEFLPDFVAAKVMFIYRGDVLIDRLNLSGSAAALATVKRCTAGVQARKAAEARAEQAEDHERKRFSDMPADPFAKD